ncbi:MucBP domain-containing protein [Loigolactobacillus backii]|uniref:MucBP domain-containing protein n=2 Tax=Loigolactobacillus backii TaxID=375175 RepID=UPI0013045367|nr:MucBP domain-containing protein [Loigolactobacillus backii]
MVNLNSAFAKVGTNGFYPSLEVSNQVVDYGVDYNLKNTATANDIEDGDITSNIVVKDDGGFDTKQSGSYNVTYAVTDKDGNETDQTVTVTVKAVANVQYEDEAGNSLGTGSASYPDGAFVGKGYTTSPGTIAGYTYERLANGSAAATGTLTTTPQTVIYVYQQNGAAVTVQYEDEQGNSLGTGSASYPDGAFVGKDYTTSPGTIAGYTYERLANGSAAATGTLTTTPQTVTYVYQQNGAAVTVQYEDEQGNSLGTGSAAYPDGTFVGKSYTTSPGTVSGYTYDRLATGSAAATGTLTTTPQTVTYVYQQNPVKAATVTVQYEDEQGNSLGTGSAAYPDGAFVGKGYTTSPGTVSGYTYERLGNGSAAASGKLTTTPQTVTYVYQQNPVKAATVTVQYEDEQGNSLGTGSAAYPDGAFVGMGYTTSPGTISGYTYERLATGSAAATGTLTTTPQTVTYVYQQNPIKAATVTVQYEDEQGNSLGTGSVVYPDGAFIGKSYTTSPGTISGYTYERLATDSAAATGTLTTTPQTVIYVYQQNGAAVTVQYEDEQGNSLGTGSASYPDGAFVGKGYTTSPGTISGYTYERLGNGSAAASGKLTTTPQTVTYVYQQNPVKAATVTVQYEDEQGNSLGTGSASYPDGAFVGKGYTTDSKTITGYTYDRLATGSAAATGTLTTTPQTVTYVYQQNPVKAATVTVQYEDEQGNSLGTGSTVYPDGAFVGKGYTTSPGTIAGYTYERLAAGSAAATGTLTTTPQTVTYVYQRVTAVQPTVPTQSQPTTKATKKVVASKISTKKIPVTGKTSTKLVKTKQLVTGFTNKKVKQAATTTKAVPVVEKNKMTKLPQTGETQAQSSSALGVLLLELSGLLMFGFKKRKN